MNLMDDYLAEIIKGNKLHKDSFNRSTCKIYGYAVGPICMNCNNILDRCSAHMSSTNTLSSEFRPKDKPLRLNQDMYN